MKTVFFVTETTEGRKKLYLIVVILLFLSSYKDSTSFNGIRSTQTMYYFTTLIDILPNMFIFYPVMDY
jgi:hypothetical protein